MRYLLTLFGLDTKDALRFTLHSWRHLFPTAARQLGLPENEQVEMGHWATGSAMPRRYDSMACVTELLAKSKVTNALSKGWTIAPPGCVPQVLRDDADLQTPRPCPKKAKCQPSTRAVAGFITKSKFVRNFESGCVHLWNGGLTSICNQFKCGSPDCPSDGAVFVPPPTDAADIDARCKACYKASMKYGFKLEIEEDVDAEPDEAFPFEESDDELAEVQS